MIQTKITTLLRERKRGATVPVMAELIRVDKRELRQPINELVVAGVIVQPRGWVGIWEGREWPTYVLAENLEA